MGFLSDLNRKRKKVTKKIFNPIVKSLLITEDAAATVFVVDNNVSLSANEKEQVLNEPLIMKESEILKVQASSGQVDVIASILEINREDR